MINLFISYSKIYRLATYTVSQSQNVGATFIFRSPMAVTNRAVILEFLQYVRTVGVHCIDPNMRHQPYNNILKCEIPKYKIYVKFDEMMSVYACFLRCDRTTDKDIKITLKLIISRKQHSFTFIQFPYTQ